MIGCSTTVVDEGINILDLTSYELNKKILILEIRVNSIHCICFERVFFFGEMLFIYNILTPINFALKT